MSSFQRSSAGSVLFFLNLGESHIFLVRRLSAQRTFKRLGDDELGAFHARVGDLRDLAESCEPLVPIDLRTKGRLSAMRLRIIAIGVVELLAL